MGDIEEDRPKLVRHIKDLSTSLPGTGISHERVVTQSPTTRRRLARRFRAVDFFVGALFVFLTIQVLPEIVGSLSH
ncbi:hypothetical protein QO002_001828 [Pararhizobium capsulatum DSM 1112]|uniref:DUF1211 domain-containing protein n=1 Tax=Pararhizobium capsulatum DSM 1112 TaxID=1121113 RepID=A0ABU0BN57_9HYPH|nr:hypothetical protein [Pararhizobium capsulatum]MDQ0319690.1 hypothetical protein [Pararhizobium capsulatum DSM 1112]